MRRADSGSSTGLTTCSSARVESFRQEVAWRRVAVLATLFALLVEASPLPTADAAASAGVVTPDAARSLQALERREFGTLRVLSYNVAGLPGILSSSRPARNTPKLSPLLSPYDIVLVQEDFGYHADLMRGARQEFRTAPTEPRSAMFGDGLALLSEFPPRADVRIRWTDCNGYLWALADCYAEKGFSVSRLGLARGVSLVVVNLHADAGHSPGDIEAREREFQQLAEYLERHHAGQALIVAGDTNLDESEPRDRAIVDEFLSVTHLAEVCRAFQCSGQNLDRVFFRSSARLRLSAQAWGSPDQFVDEQGVDLSDHRPVVASFGWRLAGD